MRPLTTMLTVLTVVVLLQTPIIIREPDLRELDRLEQVELDAAIRDEEALQNEAEIEALEGFTDMDCELRESETVPNPFIFTDSDKLRHRE